MRHRLGEQDHARLRRAVGAEHREAALAGLARHVADAAADAGGDHPLARTPSTPATCRRGSRRAPGGTPSGGDRHERADAEADAAAAGDVGDLRDRAERRRWPRRRRPRPASASDTSARTATARRPSASISATTESRSSLGGDAVRRRLVVGAGDVEAGDVGALARQPQRGGPPDAAGPGRAGDQRDGVIDGTTRILQCSLGVGERVEGAGRRRRGRPRR